MVVVALLVIIVGALYTKTHKQESIVQNTATILNTDGWKTYDNVEYGFQFKYPHDWELKSAEESSPIPTQKGSISFVFITPKPNDTLILFSFSSNGNYGASKGFGMPSGYIVPDMFKPQYDTLVSTFKFTK